ncbi:MAG: SUMF1/EgtB/PvdO family nonheme iron enzyme [Blastocatellia bacterium]
MEEKTVNVFVSYSQESLDHRRRVYELVARLRADGIHCVSDHLVKGSPPDGWRLWMEARIKESAYTLVVCTEAYRRRADRKEEPGKGLGVAWEAAIITDEIYRNAARNTRFIPVLFSQPDAAHIPSWLGDVTYYRADVEDSYDLLLRHLTDQPLFEEPPIGFVRKLPPLPRELIVDLGGNVKLEMIHIPGGEFLMGSNEHYDEEPIHRVRLSPYFIGKYAVTQAQWEVVMGNNPSNFKGDNLPVESVSWDDAVKFCEAISAKTGKTFRLPTEAEWEMACRAGSTGKYCFGNDEKLLGEYAWYYENADGKTHPVGQKKPNVWGLFDMHGNVWEWCADKYSDEYYAECERQGVVFDPQISATGSYRVSRGGEWDYYAAHCRSAIRYENAPGDRGDSLGFRLVRVGL